MNPAIVTIKFEGKKVRLGGFSSTGARGGYSLATYQMLQLGSFANKTVIERTRSGVGSDDRQFPPLSGKQWALKNKQTGKFARIMAGYAAAKARKGLNPYRDMWGDGKQGGHMLDNSSVRYADESVVRISFTSNKQRIKAHANELRTPFYSFSDTDARKIFDFARKLWGQNVSRLFAVFRGQRAA